MTTSDPYTTYIGNEVRQMNARRDRFDLEDWRLEQIAEQENNEP